LGVLHHKGEWAPGVIKGEGGALQVSVTGILAAVNGALRCGGSGAEGTQEFLL
jgi:hypothetical protein